MKRFALVLAGLLLGYDAAMASGIAPGKTFSTFLHHNARVVALCSSPIALATWTDKRHVRQNYRHCQIRATFRVLTPTARPTAFAHTPLPRPTATLVKPTAQPTPRSVATQTAVPAQTPEERALQLINDHRAEYGLPPLSMNDVQSANSAGHAQAMQQSGFIWHVNAAYPQFSFPQNIVVGFSSAGENVGEGGSVDQIDAAMWSEPKSAGCSGSHACNDITDAYTSVGIGVYQSGGLTWYVADFVAN